MHRNVRPWAAAVATAWAVCDFAGAAAAATLRVPSEWPSIQAGVNAARSGDTVLVAPGVYVENVDFGGKRLTLRSEAGAAQTVIDGQGRDHAVFIMHPNNAIGGSAVIGFTLRNGFGSAGPYGRGGGGVLAWFGSVTVEDNVFEGNSACNGGGLYLENISATVQRNQFRGNFGTCSGSAGGAIYATG